MTQLFSAGSPDVLYLIDISGYVFRAFHAIQPLSSPSGEPTNAILGTVNMIERLVKQCDPKRLMVAMDAGQDTFRRELYPQYKANRPPAPQELKQQLARVEELITALNVPVLRQKGVEADDLIASAVRAARQANLKVVVVSADKDLLPLVGPDVLLWDTMRDRVLGAEEVHARFGVRVDQVRDLLALTGDSSDNVPGVPSVGPKTAQLLLEEYENIDGIYADIDSIKRKKLRETLLEHREVALLSRTLVTLKDDCPIVFDEAAMARQAPDLDTLRQLYRELGFQRHLAALDAEYGAPAQASPPPPVRPAAVEVATSPSAIERLAPRPEAGWLGIAAALQSVGNEKHLIGLALCAEAHRAVYVPLQHRYVGAPPQPSAPEVGAALSRLLQTSGARLAAHDVKQTSLALDALQLTGRAEEPKSWGFDTLLASYLLDPEARHELPALAEAELGAEVRDLEALTHPKRGKRVGLDELPVEEVAAVAAQRAAAVRRLVSPLEQHLKDEKLFSLLEDLELPLTGLLADLERRGVLVDTALLARLGEDLDKRLKGLEQQAQEIAGKAFNVNSPRQLETLLFDDAGLKPLKRTKTARSTDAATLEALADQHPLPRVILEIRQLAKLKSTYIDALPSLVQPSSGRIHTRWGQATAATGRLASSDPNLQNIPIRTELGRAIRGAFVAPEGHRLVSADYSQIELRVLAHLSEDSVLIEAFRENQDVHTRTAMEIFGVPADQVTGELRRRAKAVNFGVVYGQGEVGLAKSLGIPRADAGNFIATYFRRYQGVRTFMESTLEGARKEGLVRTMLGRIRKLPDIRSSHHGRRSAAERVAMNTPIQGTAADLLKLAMLRLREPVTPGTRMVLTVHDELVFEVPEAEVEQAMPAIANAMETVAELKVPLRVEVGSGAAWNLAH